MKIEEIKYDTSIMFISSSSLFYPTFISSSSHIHLTLTSQVSRSLRAEKRHTPSHFFGLGHAVHRQSGQQTRHSSICTEMKMGWNERWRWDDVRWMGWNVKCEMNMGWCEMNGMKRELNMGWNVRWIWDEMWDEWDEMWDEYGMSLEGEKKVYVGSHQNYGKKK